MPTSLHPQAKFDPIPPDLDLHDLVDRTLNFEWVLRIPAAQIRTLGPQEFEKLVLFHVIVGGKPLVIEKWNNRLPQSLFSAEWLEKTYDRKQENVRDITGKTDIPMTTGHYLRSMKQLTDQWTATNFRDERRQRLYLKDIDCPVEWHDHLRKVMPANLFYMNQNVDDRGQQHDEDMFVDHKAAPAGDLMSSLPEEMRAQNLMCYIGHEGTYTPAHKEMCASLGQNIMVEASGNEKGEKPGSSIWFMTETKDREVVREYFLSMLGHDIEIEKHFAQINAWKKATFPVYVVEQKAGDFILVPPLAPHQVWNRGTRTMKVAWNRTTVETLDLALHEALPKARLVCRDEQYKNKAIIFHTLQKYYKELQNMEATELSFLGISQGLIRNSVRTKQVANDFKRLLKLFTEILVDEMFSSKEKSVEYVPFDGNVTCSYCRCNIFNRFLTCKHCVRGTADGGEDTFDICMECYAMGRSCLCISGLSWCEQWQWADLVATYRAWCEMVIKNNGYFDQDNSPMPFEVARVISGKKTAAQICQEQLRRRPFKDITKVEVPSDPEPSEPEVDDDGRVIKKKKPNGRKKKHGDTYRCHVCAHKDYTYKLAFCSTPGCSEAYCYGVLHRAFDEMPQSVMEQGKWRCPKCRKICNCGACRRAGNTKPYTPKTTFLGHDTRPLADDRSVEAIVDFRVHNLNWLKAAGEESRSQHSKRMQRLREAADAEKAKDGEFGDVSALANGGNVAGTDDYVDHSGEMGHISVAERRDDTVSHDNVHPVQGPAELVPEADRSVTFDEPSTFTDSNYPDPTLPGRMLGLGYYQQDDSPDKILFDPYQMPSAESMELDEPEPSEFVKKALRTAKRRARLEDEDDPDFVGPRSQPKKKQKIDHDAIVNLDPALLDEDTTMLDTAIYQGIPPHEGPPASHGSEMEDEEVEDQEQRDGEPFEPNRPSLRHARPKFSYVEIDDGAEEFNEVAIKMSKTVAGPATTQRERDPLDLTADAMRSLTGGEPAGVESGATGKKRRGRPRKSDPGPATSSAQSLPTNSTPQAGTAKRRGRPPGRRSLGNRASLREHTDGDLGEVDEHDVTIGELEAQLAREVADAQDQGEDAAHEAAASHVEQPLPGRRGRPPKNKSAVATRATRASQASATPPSTDTRFLSMAERMALRGKGFEIGQKKNASGASNDSTPRQATPSRASTPGEKEVPAIAKAASKAGPETEPEPALESEPPQESEGRMEGQDEDFFPPAEDQEAPGKHRDGSPSGPAASPVIPESPKKTGPTIVRLGDSEDEESRGGLRL